MQGLWNLIGKGQGPGRDFNYEVGDAVQGCDGKSVWTIHTGKNKVKTKLDMNRNARTLDTSQSSPLSVIYSGTIYLLGIRLLLLKCFSVVLFCFLEIWCLSDG